MYLSVLYAADKGLRGRNILQSVVDWYCYAFAHNQFAFDTLKSVAMSLYDIRPLVILDGILYKHDCEVIATQAFYGIVAMKSMNYVAHKY